MTIFAAASRTFEARHHRCFRIKIVSSKHMLQCLKTLCPEAELESANDEGAWYSATSDSLAGVLLPNPCPPCRQHEQLTPFTEPPALPSGFHEPGCQAAAASSPSSAATTSGHPAERSSYPATAPLPDATTTARDGATNRSWRALK